MSDQANQELIAPGFSGCAEDGTSATCSSLDAGLEAAFMRHCLPGANSEALRRFI